MGKKSTRKMEKHFLEVLVITSEECGELIQACSKILRKYHEKDEVSKEYINQLVEEAGDVLCLIELLQEHGLVSKQALQERVALKKEKLKIWSDLIKK